MNKVISFIDYIFYRVYLFFEKKKDVIADAKAASIVAILQCAALLDIFIIIREFYKFEMPKEYTNMYIWGLPIVIPIFVFNHYRYRYSKKIKKTNYVLFHQKWGNEEKDIKRRNGWLIVFLIFFLIFGVQILIILLGNHKGTFFPKLTGK